MLKIQINQAKVINKNREFINNFAVTTEGSAGEDDFIHTENFILIDKEKRIRGFYDGTSPIDVDRLIEDIRILEGEYDK